MTRSLLKTVAESDGGLSGRPARRAQGRTPRFGFAFAARGVFVGGEAYKSMK